jgi:hypothetical protein
LAFSKVLSIARARSRKPTRIAVVETIAETISWEIHEAPEGGEGTGENAAE